MRPKREIAATIRTSCAELEIRSIVGLSMIERPVRLSVNFASMTACMARPARRQKRKRGSTESRFDFSRKDPVGKSSSARTNLRGGGGAAQAGHSQRESAERGR